MTQIPEDLRYTENDEWVRLEGDEVVVGITDYAQDALSDIVYVELPSAGDSFAAGETFGVVESVKAASDLYAPISGAVTAVNDDLADTPERLNEDPYGAAWLVRLRPADVGQLDKLMDAAAYQAHVDRRG